MTRVIGLDTGGTYTDAALVDTDAGRVVATGKALTTRDDLSIGVGGAIRRILDNYDGDASDIGLISLSTTLATNAVVEGVGGRVCLVMIGFDEDALGRADLARALGQDDVFFISGGHAADGAEQAVLDEGAIRAAASKTGSDVSAYAVAAHFATRNPAHERRARDIIRDITGCPVTCSHELSSALGGPRRALTAVLNARLINLLDRLIAATESIMTDLQLNCPLMVVKGDGSLLRADFARSRPVETVLSGPAASLAGAAFLAGAKTAMVADIGGTTTDIALLQNGAPRLKNDGALVGGWKTMVEAADIRTCGLGGDSEVLPVTRGTAGGLTLGPRRAVPLSLLATQWPQVKDILAEQLGVSVPMATDGRFVMPLMPNGVPGWLTRSEARLAAKAIEMGPTSVAEIASTQLALGAVDRLIGRGLLTLAAFTPTDALHVTGDFDEFDSDAARLGAELMARQRNGVGAPVAKDAATLAQITLGELHRRSGVALMDAALAHDGAGEGQASSNPLLNELYRGTPGTAGLPQQAGLVNLKLSLDTGVIALGASAATHYPHVAHLMGVDLTVPDHADVAGAVGAAAGTVRQRVMISVSQPDEGRFRVHLPTGPQDMTDMEAALQAARDAATALANDRALQAGATVVDVCLSEDVKLVPLSADRDMFIEALVYATADGRAG
ncbi:MAG TPA: hydantoinase [Alphaproteobacteria bacterium]|nr:hydantoinase [Alphaproteobacteria bacterium]HCA14110.1 hydantoinase [Alphaproteobacteria bacterium]|tara:strand:+ start:2120 stop:4138 length:2019 start_codon:yes stop_codon:yes gene_type:complete